LQTILTTLRDMEDSCVENQRDTEKTLKNHKCHCDKHMVSLEEEIEMQKASIDENQEKLDKMASAGGGAGANLQQAEEDKKTAEESLAAATTQREKEAAEFHEIEVQSTQSISALDAAKTALEKVHPDAPHGDEYESSLVQAKKTIAALATGFPSIVKLSEDSHRTLSAFIQAEGPMGYDSYAPQSGQIFGIISQMKQDFENDLNEAKTEENNALSNFAQVSEGYNSEIAQLSSKISELNELLGDSANGGAEAKEQLETSKVALEAAQTELSETNVACQTMEQEGAKRMKVFEDEEAAIKQTIEILDSDDAFSTFNSAFVQTSSSAVSLLQMDSRSPLKTISAVAQKMNAPALLDMASKAQMKGLSDDFVNTMLTMITDLKTKMEEEAKADVSKKDTCTGEIQEHKMLLDDLAFKLEENHAKKENLEQSIEEGEENIKKTESEFKERTEIQADAASDREEANADFNKLSVNNANGAKILEAAVKKLNSYYKKETLAKEITAKSIENNESNPHQISADANLQDHNTPLELMQKLQQDLQAEIASAEASEKREQETYGKATKEFQDFELRTQKIIAELSQQNSDSAGQLQSVQGEITSTATEQSNSKASLVAVRQDCDNLLTNFDTIQETRRQEMDMLDEAVRTFQGALDDA